MGEEGLSRMEGFEAANVHLGEIHGGLALDHPLGQGLAHADIIGRRPQARILVGDVEPGMPVTYQWTDLNMPFEAHCSERLHKILGGDDYADQLEPLKAACIAADG